MDWTSSTLAFKESDLVKLIFDLECAKSEALEGIFESYLFCCTIDSRYDLLVSKGDED